MTLPKHLRASCCTQCGGQKVFAHGLCRRCYVLQHLYGLTPLDVDRMLEAQDRRCALCREPFGRFVQSGPGRGAGKGGLKYHIDHDHATGRVFGLLCPGCNRLEGMLAKRGFHCIEVDTYRER